MSNWRVCETTEYPELVSVIYVDFIRNWCFAEMSFFRSLECIIDWEMHEDSDQEFIAWITYHAF